jgi:hypothetical protein
MNSKRSEPPVKKKNKEGNMYHNAGQGELEEMITVIVDKQLKCVMAVVQQRGSSRGQK